jgi:hypothetical protein
MASTGTSRIPPLSDDKKGCSRTNRILDELLPDPAGVISAEHPFVTWRGCFAIAVSVKPVLSAVEGVAGSGSPIPSTWWTVFVKYADLPACGRQAEREDEDDEQPNFTHACQSERTL